MVDVIDEEKLGAGRASSGQLLFDCFRVSYSFSREGAVRIVAL